MGFKEFIEKLGEKRRERKERLRIADEDLRIMKILEERQKSANERELERYLKDEREVKIKENLEYYRKKREQEINFNHNVLDIPNVTNHSDWEVLKERNQFANNKNIFANQRNMFVGQRNIFRS